MNNKRIALLGLGTIGQVVFDELVASTNGAWQLAWVVVKHPERHQTVLLPTGAQLTIAPPCSFIALTPYLQPNIVPVKSMAISRFQ